jgi:SAM-dependent methyltransferase
MDLIKRTGAFLDNPIAYRLWQGPVASAKMAPVMRHNDLRQARHVLDLGCGPGTNCPYFPHGEYLGLDINPRYVDYARRRYERTFAVEDIRSYRPSPGGRFDFVLLNSVLHHLDDEATNSVLTNLGQVVSDGGHVHIIELVLPRRNGLAKSLALGDRGDYPRPLDEWETIFCKHFEPVVFEPFAVKALLGITLWNLVYFKGKIRT